MAHIAAWRHDVQASRQGALQGKAAVDPDKEIRSMVLDDLQTFMDRLFGCGHCPGAEVHAQGQGRHVVGQDDRRPEAEGEAASLEPSAPLTSLGPDRQMSFACTPDAGADGIGESFVSGCHCCKEPGSKASVPKGGRACWKAAEMPVAKHTQSGMLICVRGGFLSTERGDGTGGSGENRGHKARH